MAWAPGLASAARHPRTTVRRVARRVRNGLSRPERLLWEPEPAGVRRGGPVVGVVASLLVADRDPDAWAAPIGSAR